MQGFSLLNVYIIKVQTRMKQIRKEWMWLIVLCLGIMTTACHREEPDDIRNISAQIDPNNPYMKYNTPIITQYKANWVADNEVVDNTTITVYSYLTYPTDELVCHDINVSHLPLDYLIKPYMIEEYKDRPIRVDAEFVCSVKQKGTSSQTDYYQSVLKPDGQGIGVVQSGHDKSYDGNVLYDVIMKYDTYVTYEESKDTWTMKWVIESLRFLWDDEAYLLYGISETTKTFDPPLTLLLVTTERMN